ncbi:MAG TPA: glycosyltransferase [Candidatus Binatia bacterium]|nr:glycosyltransferase [Candidatus Binatia bacterium]
MFEAVHVPPLRLADYASVAPQEDLVAISELAERLRGARVLHLNSTKFGGGVAEILPTLTALLDDVGLAAEWRVIAGDDAFFAATKALHNALQGDPRAWTDEHRRHYEATTRHLATAFEGEYDVVVVHDPQPLGIRALRPELPGRWIWRCHIDLSTADEAAWQTILPWVNAYDAVVFTLPAYARSGIEGPVVAVAPPSIDPLSPKNRPLPSEIADDVVHRFGVDPTRPLLLQVSRFDPWKDPLGVIDAYRLVKAAVADVQLALIGSMATDDPEGWSVYKRVLRYAGQDEDLHVLTNIDGVGPLEVNAFQRASEVVLQKSIREGFGLTVSEALWKGIPVVGGRVGGIPIQIGDDRCGRLVDDVPGAAAACLELLADPALRAELGRRGHERVRRNFLSTRNLRDDLALFVALAEDRRDLVPRGEIDESLSGEDVAVA